VPTSTATATHTRTHTATYLTDLVLGTIGDLLADLGIDATRLYRDWAQDEAAIKQWIEEESLAMVVLECVQPSGKVAPIVEFPVRYTATGLGDAAFTAQRAKLARFRAKLEAVPRGTAFRLFCTYRTAHTPMPGWSPGRRASTEGMRATNFGLLGSAPHASASMRLLS
jgi:Bacterial HORMA domain 2